MANDLVAYSRQGDVFHYRWAARRCLKLVHPNTMLTEITIEGSNEIEKLGEYVIDVAEYYDASKDNETIKYFQLKHTTVQKDDPFVLSDLKDTFVGFSKRFSQHLKDKSDSSISFTIVTNRKIENSFKQNIRLLAQNKSVAKRFKDTIENYTGLTSGELAKFSALINFDDTEGDYNSQKDELSFEIGQLVAGAIDNAQIENIVSIVQEKATAIKNKSINREDILRRFGFSSEKDLFPAPAIWEESENFIACEQHETLKERIFASSFPVIVHASGGVGKSVFCRQIVDSLPINSIGIAYDCFGAGQYRNTSNSRHRHRDALVQIVNELAVKGLCDPILVQNTSLDSDIMKKFLWRIETVVKTLRETNNSANLFILIDAADNAEMAAHDFAHPCFANELLRENIPNGCKLVLLCRTERIKLLKPNSKIPQIKLETFTESETLQNLRRYFPESDERDGAEFHRLTSGNPRVQANALSIQALDVFELLNRLGPIGTSVEEQIEMQLENAVSSIKDQLSEKFQEEIQSICLGLACLPPHIPVEILARAANVTIESIESFVTGIGRSLWLSDDSVQFRDEPTETWFREKYLAETDHFEAYIKILNPLATDYTYVAEILPQLYLLAEKYEELIELALSENYLPKDNPIDSRNVRVNRLQFAFRAALRTEQYKDAVKISMRAGEEVAGNQRQLNLFQNNVDLLVSLQDKQKVQDIAFKRILNSAWNGSENVYTASLLSGIPEYKGEARGYLRASLNWLQIYYEEQRKNKVPHLRIRNNVQDGDILELAFALFNIYGVKECIDFLNRFTHKRFVFGIMQNFSKRLIDIGNIEAIDSILTHCITQPYYNVAIVHELLKIGRIPDKNLIEPCLDLLLKAKTRIEKPRYVDHNDVITPAILSFIEVGFANNLPSKKLLKVLSHYVPENPNQSIYTSHFSIERSVFLQALAIRMLLVNKALNIDDILPQNLVDKKNKSSFEYDNDIKKIKEVVNGLFPWYFLRAKILNNQEINFKDAIKQTNQESLKGRQSRYQTNDNLPSEITYIQASILILNHKLDADNINAFYESYLENNKALSIGTELNIVRAAFRLNHLSPLKHKIERHAYQRIKSFTEDGPDEIAEKYIKLARAVLINSKEDASVYFEEAVTIVSKFGDEIVIRWNAIVSIAMQASRAEVPDELAYRFIRCAEVVGENVAREKHWDRSEAMAISTRLSSGVGISALSRWRDRGIGRFNFQLEALLTELVKLNKIKPSECWALSKFLPHHNLEDLLLICLQNESETTIKHNIFSDALKILRFDGVPPSYWEKMQQIAVEYNIENEALDKIIRYHHSSNAFSTESQTEDKILEEISIKKKPPIVWNRIFGKLDILNLEQFEKAFDLFNKKSKNEYYRYKTDFWVELLQRLKEQDLFKFIDIIISSKLSRYEIKYFFEAIPNDWLNKVSFVKKWPNLVQQLGKKYATELTAPGFLKYFSEDFNLNEERIKDLKNGIFEGLANNYDFSNAETFFGFVNISIPLINSSTALELLDFSLSRFELHFEEDSGDGEWGEWLHTTDNTNKNIAGFIWSSLGSPRSEERWNAIHCVRKLAEFNNTEILDELVYWMQRGEVAAFGNHNFPFYNLHARQYLLIALARISFDTLKLLMKHKDTFIEYAFGEPHILIQKYASELAINLLSGDYNNENDELLKNLKVVGKTIIPIIDLDYNTTINSYWHDNNEVSSEYEFNFGWDFDKYWFEPLGDVFGIPGKQAEDIAANIIINEWGVIEKNGYNNDPRVGIWNNHSHERETWHDHGSYPKTDNLDFYLSYNSLMSAAAKLIQKMPVTSKRDWYDQPWEEWLSRHLLTFDNGKWLSDYRDPLPLNRPTWITSDKKETWQNDIQYADFIYYLLGHEKENTWIAVKGGSHEKLEERKEVFSVSTALVSKNSSDALLRALTTCSDHMDYKLPDFNEERMEIDSDMFQLKGWLADISISKGIEELDPHAFGIEPPSFLIDETILNQFNLITDEVNKAWLEKDSLKKVMISRTWCSSWKGKDEEVDQSGLILAADLSFLKNLCTTLDCELIFDVSLKRDINRRYSNEKREYSKPQHKIFILSADGKLRTSGESDYQIG